MGVEELDGQPLHVLEHALAEFEHGALADFDHDAVVGVGTGHADDEHRRKFEEGCGERGEVGVVHSLQGFDVVVDERLGEQGGHQRGAGGDDDEDEDGDEGELVVFHHKLEQSQQRGFLVLAHLL